jgi:4-hydroxy-tetrahydrodipicolinate synthase
MMDAFEEGNLSEARKLHFKMMPINNTMFIETNPIPVKTALALMGKIKEEMRLPLTSMAEKGRETLKSTLKDYGLI